MDAVSSLAPHNVSATPRGPSRKLRLAPLQNLTAEALRVHEVYVSVQGEGSHVGLPCTFVRLTGCPLRCSYCDTPHAFREGEVRRLTDVVEEVRQKGPRLVLVTGGEPLAQPGALPLMRALCDAGLQVLLETSGALPIDDVDPRVVRIVDFKTPSSGELNSNLWSNVAQLQHSDEVKFVVGDRADYVWARDQMARHALATRCQVLFGPVWQKLDPAQLVAWMLEDALDARLQVQLHKYIWDPAARGV